MKQIRPDTPEVFIDAAELHAGITEVAVGIVETRPDIPEVLVDAPETANIIAVLVMCWAEVHPAAPETRIDPTETTNIIVVTLMGRAKARIGFVFIVMCPSEMARGAAAKPARSRRPGRFKAKNKPGGALLHRPAVSIFVDLAQFG